MGRNSLDQDCFVIYIPYDLYLIVNLKLLPQGWIGGYYTPLLIIFHNLVILKKPPFLFIMIVCFCVWLIKDRWPI